LAHQILGPVKMKISPRVLVLVFLAASMAASAQQPASPSKSAAAPADAAAKPAASPAQPPNRADAYYHFQLGHIDEDMAALTGRNEYADQALEEYKAAVAADPGSAFLASSLAELYARTGNIREAVAEAQDIISRHPDNLEARRLLGHIYLRSIGEVQGATEKENVTILRLAIEQFEQIVRLDPNGVEDHLLLGRLYRLDGQTGKAEGEFRTAVALQPSSEEAVTTLALLFNEESDPGRALDILLSVPEADRTARIDSVLGYTYEQKKDYARAAEFYRKAIALDADDLDAVRGLAENLLNLNQNDAALEQYKKIAAADPQDAQTQLHMSEIYRRDGQFEKALEALNKAQTIAPDSVEVEYNRAVVEEAMGKFDDAERQLNDLLTKTENPKSDSDRNNRAIFLERLGSVYRDQNKTQAAVETFRKMLTLGGDAEARAYQQIVECYRDAKDWTNATAVAREAVAKLPKDQGLQMVLAGQEADNGQPDAAIARVKAMLKGTSADREVWIALAQMYSRLRRYPEAEKAVAKALELSTKQEDKDYVHFIAGSIYERQKKYNEAESYFRKVLASDPKSATTLNYLGYMLADRGTRLDEALSLIRRAVTLEPQNGAYLDSLGWVQFKMGKYDLAEASLRKAIDRMDNDPTVHEHLGDVYQKTNRLKLAVGQWERSLQEWKKNVPAEVEPADVAKVQKKLDEAKTKLAKQPAESATK
jgi:tetratricopeptide (TPR) repeat protein